MRLALVIKRPEDVANCIGKGGKVRSSRRNSMLNLIFILKFNSKFIFFMYSHGSYNSRSPSRSAKTATVI